MTKSKVNSTKELRTKIDSSQVLKATWKQFKNPNNKKTFSEILTLQWGIARSNVYTFDQIYKLHYNSVLNYVKFRLNNDINYAENLTNDIFIKVAKNIKTYSPQKAKLSTWIGQITNTTIIDFYRSTKHKTKFTNIQDFQDDKGNEFFTIESNYNDENNMETNELKDKINKSISKLNPKLQEVCKAYFIQELKYDEIANLLNIPMGSVKGYINLIRKKLQKDLQNIYTSA